MANWERVTIRFEVGQGAPLGWLRGAPSREHQAAPLGGHTGRRVLPFQGAWPESFATLQLARPLEAPVQ